MCPQWVSPIERDGLFLTSGKEGRLYFLQLVGAVIWLSVAVAGKLGRGGLVRVMAKWWYGRTQMNMKLALVLSRPLGARTKAELLPPTPVTLEGIALC